MRVDKYLWAIRVYKTRSQAGDACSSGKVYIGDSQIKASRAIKVGDVIMVKKPPVMYSYKVKELLGKRVGAKLVDDYREDITSQEELDKLDYTRNGQFGTRDRGEGRPTKKDRRSIDKFTED